jgi:D-glycero-D-manno-heptose 1,7-bisphosphate phosphatase
LKKPAAFFDRDGTLSDEIGYVNHVSRIRAVDGGPEAIARLNKAGVPVVMVTNQAGAARGYFPLSLIDEVNAALLAQYSDRGATIDAVYYCPHLPSSVIPELAVDCDCRKPKPGLLLRAAADWNLSLAGSFVIGDKYSDVELGFAMGGEGILVLTGYGLGERQWFQHTWKRPPSLIAKDLGEVVDHILRKLNIDV